MKPNQTPKRHKKRRTRLSAPAVVCATPKSASLLLVAQHLLFLIFLVAPKQGCLSVRVQSARVRSFCSSRCRSRSARIHSARIRSLPLSLSLSLSLSVFILLVFVHSFCLCSYSWILMLHGALIASF